MAMTRRRFVVAAGVSALGALAARAAERLEPAVAAAVPALRPSSRGTSAGRCALCGSTTHATLDATCAEACSGGTCSGPTSTTLCGAGECYACNGAGLCNTMPTDDAACTVSCTGTYLYQQTGDPNGWDGFTWCQRASTSGTGGRCQTVGTCKTPAQWCTTAGTYSNWTLATLCEMFQAGTCTGQVGPTPLEAAGDGSVSCNGTPEAWCWDEMGAIQCEMEEDPRPIWPESGSHVAPPSVL